MKNEVINQIKQYRAEKQMTQEDLAKLANVSRQSIISIEQGRYVPSLSLALKLAKIFDCPTDDLFRLMEDIK